MALFLEKRRQATDKPLQFCLILGAMKCGTSKLFEELKAHPRICGSTPKETNFFTNLMESGAAGSCSGEQILERYSEYWPEWHPLAHHYALEASTSYSKVPFKPAVAESIARVAAETQAAFKYIYVLRNPVDAIGSFYRHAFSTDLTWASQHRAAMLEHGILSANALAIYSYAKQLDNLTHWLPRKSILLINFDDLTQRPERVYARIKVHLGLDKSYEIQNSGVVHSAEQRFEGYTRQTGSAMPPTLQCWSLSEQHRAAVVHLLSNDVHRLRSTYGFDTSSWHSF